jgi:iron complex outermembrane recepter protein
MAKALAELAREGGVELLFDPKLVQGLNGNAVQGRLSAEAALAILLAGSGVGYRITPDGAFVLVAAPAAKAPGSGDGAIAEILVVGRRTQNVDIRRAEDDIQPYHVATADDLETAHRDTVDEYMRAREPADTQVRQPNQDFTQLGSTRSAIDLRGFGSQQTLVLIDGQRMPSLPSFQGEFNQSDLNGVSIGSIDRIETLTSTAGGIYGPGAIGGVVNVVLRRDYRGETLNLTSGVTDRGDAAQVRLEGRIGFTPDHGATDIMLFGAYAASEPLLAGQRDLAERARALAAANDPKDFAASGQVSNAITISSINGNLTLAPQFGGASLGSPFTFLPINFVGTQAQRIATLVANGGKVTPILPEDDTGVGQYLLSNPAVASFIFSVRHRLSDNVELFADGLYFFNAGTFRGGGLDIPPIAPANSPNNPFLQNIIYRFPEPDVMDLERLTTVEDRFIVGLIATLPWGWKATADYAIGGASVGLSASGRTLPIPYGAAIATGAAGPGGLPVVSPLGNWSAFLAASAAYLQPESVGDSLNNRFSDPSLRLAGPVVSLPGGPLTLTLLGESREERIPASVALFADPGLSATPIIITLPVRTKSDSSAYAELLAPIAPADARFPLLRGLEVQLAARFDDTAITLPEDGTPGSPSNNRLITVRSGAASYTAGFRVLPIPALMLRASVATGQLPPTITQLQTMSATISNDTNPDPRRGGEPLTADGSFVVLSGGSHDVRAEQARTLSLGAVLNPSGAGGPRLSADFSRTVTTGEIEPFLLNRDQLVLAEASYPRRVVRAPLTDADRAMGFTVGRVIELNTGMINSGWSVVDAIDFRLDWALPAGPFGRFRLYGRATWEPNDVQHIAPGQPAINQVDFSDGPLAWRANVGVEWTRGPLSIDLNAQYFDSYSVTYINPPFPNAQLLAFQGAERIPSQTYIDLALARRFDVRGQAGPLKVVEVRLGIQNLFDRLPPIVAAPAGPGYSPYGDPRGRRFELSVSSRF